MRRLAKNLPTYQLETFSRVGSSCDKCGKVVTSDRFHRRICTQMTTKVESWTIDRNARTREFHCPGENCSFSHADSNKIQVYTFFYNVVRSSLIDLQVHVKKCSKTKTK